MSSRLQSGQPPYLLQTVLICHIYTFCNEPLFLDLFKYLFFLCEKWPPGLNTLKQLCPFYLSSACGKKYTVIIIIKTLCSDEMIRIIKTLQKYYYSLGYNQIRKKNRKHKSIILILLSWQRIQKSLENLPLCSCHDRQSVKVKKF